MKQERFVGVIPPVLTLFTKEGELDETLQKEFTEFLVNGGVHGLFVGGTYGSGILMSGEQRRRLLDITVDRVKGRIPIISHVGAADTKTAVELARHAQDKGVAAIAAVPPFYFAHDERAILGYYEALVKSVDLPVFAYNNPKASGFTITPRMAVELARAGLAGMKDSSFDVVLFAQAKDQTEAAGLDFELIIGTEALWAAAALLGAKAMVAGLANVFPELVVSFYEATVQEGLGAAARLQPRILRAREVMKLAPTIPACHAILELRGLPAGFPKAPFQPLSGAEKERVRKALVAEGLL